MLLIAVSAHAGAERPRKVDRHSPGTVIAVTPPLKFALQQLVIPMQRQLQSAVMAPVSFPRRPQMSRSYAPVRQITFLGGDRITAEIALWAGDQVALRTKRGQVAVVPRASIVTVSQPPGEQDIVYESFEETQPVGIDDSSKQVHPAIASTRFETVQSASGLRSLRCATELPPITYRFPAALKTSRVQFWFRVDGPSTDLVDAEEAGSEDAASLRVDFAFGTTRAESSWTFQASHDRSVVSGAITDIVNSQTVRLTRGWHCATLVLESDHAMFAVDDTLLVSTARSPGPLAALAISSTATVWIDDLLVSETNVPSIPRDIRPSTQDDCLALRDGEEWFGRITQVTATHVVLSTSTGDRTAAWSRVERLALCQSDQPTGGPIGPPGLCSRIQFQSAVDRPELAADHLVGTMTSTSRDYCLMAHPWLGELAVDWSDIKKFEPYFHGRLISVDARQQHLGSSIRIDFQRPVPDGTEWTVEFNVPDPLPEQAEFWLSLDAIDLEPSGPGTPLASPWLKELRAGKLVTDVNLNGQPAGDLNRWIRYRAPVTSPEKLRCPLPPGLIKPGLNTLTLSQVLLNESGMTDNCELANLRIEVVIP